jgi:DNA-binding CsgD family transcriptional regulator
MEGTVLRVVLAALSGSESMRNDAEPLLHALASAVGMSGGVLWLPDGRVLVPRATWAAERSEQQTLEKSVHAVRTAVGVGLVGHAWESREPRSAPRVPAGTQAEAGQAQLDTLRAAVAVPARVKDTVLGVVELYASRGDEPYRERETLAALRPAPHLLGTLLERWVRHSTDATLTKRELELLVFASNGSTSPEIAVQLSISPWTVKTHFENIRFKLAVPDRAAAVAVAIRTGMIA